MDNQLTREDVLKLMDEKSEIEKQLHDLRQILDQNSVGMNEDLVDEDGFPRQDIDVYQVRHARHKIICLQNDHKDIMKKIEVGLHSIHAQINETNPVSGGSSQSTRRARKPIVRVNLVEVDSPAALAGLEVDDLIVEFGTLNDSNFNSLQDIGSLVKHSVNRKIPVRVRRKGTEVSVQLIPKEWSGKGLLGCNVIPVEHVDR